MPCKEDTAEVDLHGVVDVCGDEVFESAFCARNDAGWILGWLLLQTKYSVDVVKPLFRCEGAPDIVSKVKLQAKLRHTIPF
jgi:hypothetical protein